MDAHSDITSILELESRLAEIKLPMDEVVPERVRPWLEAFACSNGTTSEMVLCAALVSTSALIGHSTLQLFGTYEEKGNLYVVVTAPSGTGKTPACQKGCIEPIVGELEEKIQASMVIDETSSSGLFNHFVTGSTVPILCVDEAYSLFHRLTKQGKSATQTTLSLERLCKCYDGDFWYILKGTKGKRMGVSSAKLALLAFTTPQQFLESVWPKIVSSKNGLAERIMYFYQRRSSHIDLEAMAEHSNSLEEFSVKTLGGTFEKMFTEHNTKPAIKYTLTATAKELFFKFSKPNEDSLEAGPSSGSGSVSLGSKKFKNTLRVALNMHILYHRLTKALELETGPTPTVVTVTTMQMAIAFTETLETMKGISELSCSLKTSSVGLKVGVPSEDIKKRVLCLPGPFVSARRVARSFSSARRPSSKVTQEVMAALQTAGIGKVLTVNKLVVFLKKIPTIVIPQQIAACGVSPDEYTEAFQKADDKLTSDMKENIIEAHPNWAEVEAYLARPVH